MTVADFRASATPPPGISPALAALWQAARGDWDRAHEIAQSDRTANGSWVHAYLHRQEGDNGNAGYWYSRAGKSMPATSLDEEWAAIARELLAR
jgi:hypothetical protein